MVLDSSVLLGRHAGELLAAAHLGYFRGYWSSWIITEFTRVRTEWIALQVAKNAVRSRLTAGSRSG